jgi:dipeptide/tripeptide permease
MRNQIITSIGEFVDRFAYYGYISIYVLLAIALTHSSGIAIREYGLYGTFGFSLPTVIGYLSDKWKQHYTTTLLGLVFFIIACTTLMIHYTHTGFIVSSALLLLGIGCFKSNNLKVFSDHIDHQGRLNIYYAFMTAGSIVGPLIFGYYFNVNDTTTALLITALLSLFMLITYGISFKKNLCDELKHNKCILMFTATVSVLLIIIASYHYNGVYNSYLFILSVMVLIIFKQINIPGLRKKLIILLLFSTVFFTSEMLTFGVLLLYIKNHVGTRFYSINIPLPYFTIILSVVAILCSLGFSKKLIRMENKITNIHYYKLILGGFLGALSMLLRLLSYQKIENINILIILSSLFILGIADFLIAPSILAYLAQFATEKIKSSLYSLWFMSIALSSYLSVKLFNISNIIQYAQHNHYNNYYFTFLLSALLILLTLPFMRILKS